MGNTKLMKGLVNALVLEVLVVMFIIKIMEVAK